LHHQEHKPEEKEIEEKMKTKIFCDKKTKHDTLKILQSTVISTKQKSDSTTNR